MAGAHLILRTVEEGNSQHSLNLHFTFEASTKNMVLRAIILSANNAYCDQSLKSVHVLPKNHLLSTPLENFDGFAAFQELKALRQKLQHGEIQGLKVMPSDIS